MSCNINTDVQALMIAIAKMANMEAAHCRRMILVLDMDDLPRLYVETFLEATKPIDLPNVELAVTKGPIDATVMHNEQFRTKVLKPE